MTRVNCVFFADYQKCSHLDRGRGFLWLGKNCVLVEDFPSECRKQVPHPRPKGPPPPASEP